MSAAMELGVILERREIDNPWQDHSWLPVGLLPGVKKNEPWRVMREGEGYVHFVSNGLTLELFPKETEGYKHNLSTDVPKIFVVLRACEEDGDVHEVEPFLITACPYEAQDYLDSGEEIVEGVPMSPKIAAWVEEYVNEHYVEEPFVKRRLRKNKLGDRGKKGNHNPGGRFSHV